MLERKLYILISILIFSNTLVFAQISETHINNIPEDYSDGFTVTCEKEVGKRLSYKSFKRGEFVDANQKEIRNSMNTMLLGSATALFDYLKETYEDFQPIVIKPNGFTSTSFYIKYKYSKGEIFIIRTMKSKEFLKGPFAAENPENYNLLFAFNFDEDEDQKEVENILNKYIEENYLESEIQNR
tara:strand:+ start:549 stop:1100 length:552 start_codon:yes stop_codon:yes gene_type:complete